MEVVLGGVEVAGHAQVVAGGLEARGQLAPAAVRTVGIVDEAAFRIDYETLDRILEGLDRGWGAAQVAASCAEPEVQVWDVQELVRRSRHLREFPPCLDLGGVGRRQPG